MKWHVKSRWYSRLSHQQKYSLFWQPPFIHDTAFTIDLTPQLMALRMRRKGTQVFVIAPLKEHELLCACRNTGGEFIQISSALKSCINIMETRKTDKSVDEMLDGTLVKKSELAALVSNAVFAATGSNGNNHHKRRDEML